MSFAAGSTYGLTADSDGTTESAKAQGMADGEKSGSPPVRLEFAQNQVAQAIGVVENTTTFDDVSAVRNLLQRRPALLELLIDTLPRIFDTFDFDDIVVSVSRPDEDEKQREPGLYVRVISPLDVEAALAQLDEFDDEWLDYPFEVRQQLCVDIDFR